MKSAKWVSAVVGRGSYSVPATPCSPKPCAQLLRRVRKRRFQNDILCGVVVHAFKPITWGAEAGESL